ncbi:hypothetical protein Tco_1069462 [Tanacetum coccineum]|uniref:Uncharacterized protein n=1 Tax=Tanacetum coccineum TaxID=301880 RepID=A0ABQ5HJ15_9ASTR
MFYPRFTKVIVDYFMAKDPSISRRNKMFWHTARDDSMFTTIRVISKHQDTQVYGAILPQHLTNQAMLESKAYKTYRAYATGEKTPNQNVQRRKLILNHLPRRSVLKLIKEKESRLQLREMFLTKPLHSLYPLAINQDSPVKSESSSQPSYLRDDDAVSSNFQDLYPASPELCPSFTMKNIFYALSNNSFGKESPIPPSTIGTPSTMLSPSLISRILSSGGIIVTLRNKAKTNHLLYFCPTSNFEMGETHRETKLRTSRGAN